ncbi:MAG: glycosyltransferase family 39 protein [Desulfobulbaceae bacterium]|nr:glycosyltransferase family 39 protein [Desulfobulbaceae bacterium]
MTVSQELKSLKLTCFLLIAGLVLRIVLSGQFLLTPDEANYWQWSRYLDLSYQDHPPMIAWTIWLSTSLFGQHEWAVRLPTILGLTLAMVYMAKLAAKMFSWQTALHATLLNQGILLFNGAALVATPDGMLLPCWAGACYHGAQALKKNSMRQWLLTGLWFGIGMLSKYTMILFLPSLLLCILLIEPYRKRLFQPAPWLGLLVSLFVFCPVILWNMNNEWATFRHVLYMGGIDTGNFFTLRYVGDFLAEQAALLSPLVFLIIVAAWFFKAKKSRLPKADISYLLWMSLPTFLVFLLLSFHSRVYGNWTAAGYLCAIILIAAMYRPGHAGIKDGSNKIWILSLITAYLFTLPVLIQVVYPVLPVPVHLDRTARETVGWDTLGKAVRETVYKMPGQDRLFIFGIRYQIASELAFYVPGQPRTVSINHWNRPNVYDFWFDDTMLVGNNGVGVTRDPKYAKHLATVFDRFELDREVPIYRESPWRGREKVITYYIYRAYGFKGGQRWKPRNKEDIRATKKQTAD